MEEVKDCCVSFFPYGGNVAENADVLTELKKRLPGMAWSQRQQIFCLVRECL